MVASEAICKDLLDAALRAAITRLVDTEQIATRLTKAWRYVYARPSTIGEISPEHQVNNIYCLTCRSRYRIAEVSDARETEMLGESRQMAICLCDVPTKILRKVRRCYLTNVRKFLEFSDGVAKYLLSNGMETLTVHSPRNFYNRVQFGPMLE